MSNFQDYSLFMIKPQAVLILAPSIYRSSGSSVLSSQRSASESAPNQLKQLKTWFCLIGEEVPCKCWNSFSSH